MPKEILIALGGGGASAVASLTLLTGSPGAVLLAYLAPLPILLVGLGNGIRAGTLAGAAGFMIAGLLGGGLAAGIYGLLHALPALLVIRQALLQRPGPDGTAIWYPAGAILCWLAILAGALFLAVAIMATGENGGIETLVKTNLERIFAAMLPSLGDAERTGMVNALSPFFPGVVATSWVLMTVINAALAQSILSRMGRNLRPTGALAGLTLPDWISWCLVLAAALALIGTDELEYIGRNLTLIFGAPFFFLGLAVVHALAATVSFPGTLLAVFYLVLLFSGWAVFVVAGVGMFEQWIGLRQRFIRPGNDQEVE